MSTNAAASRSTEADDGTDPRPPVPWRTIAATIAMVLGTVVTIAAIEKLSKVITWMVIAGFLALVLNPVVNLFTKRLHLRRGIAVALTMVLAIAGITGMLYAFIHPLVKQASTFSDKFPAYVEQAKTGRGEVGKLVKRYKLDDYVEKNQDKLKAALSNAGRPAAKLATGIFSTLAALVTIIVLMILFLVEGEKLVSGTMKLIPPKRRERVRRVASDCTRAVTGYMGGNLLISVIAGVATYLFLLIAGVPFAGVLALWVAFADLIPLVGATLGAVVTCGVAFLDSPKAGIATLVFYVLYQQFENHVLSVTIMARTVKLNPLAVMVSLLVGVELFGILGALLAIPAGGVIQVILRDVYDNELGMLKDEPTIGEDEVPVAELIREEIAEEQDVPASSVSDEEVDAIEDGSAVKVPVPSEPI